MDTRNLSGFRICIQNCIEENAESRKCFIFINERWSKIKSVQDHIKNIFNIDEEVHIYIGDVLLPENETIKLIQPDDILIVRTVKLRKDDLYSVRNTSFQNDNSPPKLKKSKKISESKSIDSSEKLLADCLEELRNKKEQIVKETVLEIDSVSTVNDCNEAQTLFGIPPKKRKRKHKKKLKAMEMYPVEETNTNETYSTKFDSLDSSSNHIHFFDEDYQEDLVQSSSKVNGNTADEFRSSLLNLVNKPTSQKIFSRKSENTVTTTPTSDFEAPTLEPNSINQNENKSELVDPEKFVPKIGDLISFKKIKLGNDYTPQKSNNIVGEVMTIEKSDDSCIVVFNIKEGNEEFENPSGKFSLEADEDKADGDKIHVAEMEWKDILEPRLIKRL